MATIVFALLSATLYGSADFLGGLATRRSSVMPVIIFSQLAGLITLLLALPFLPPTTATHADFAWGALAGGALGIGLMLLYQGLATGKMSVVAPVTAVLAVVVSAVAGIVLGDRLSISASLGVVLAIGAITLISQDGVQKATREPGLGIAQALCLRAFGGGLDRRVLRCAQTKQPHLRPVAASVGAARRARRPRFRRLLATVALRVGRDAVWLIVVGGALDILANVLYLLATRVGMLTIAATLASLYPASTILLARLVLGERLRRIQITGLACAGVGVALIGAG